MDEIEQLHIGMTGSRNGISDFQLLAFREHLEAMPPWIEVFVHHGDCIGADEHIHNLVCDVGWQPVIHPPVKGELRAWCESDIILPEENYYDRNRNIVKVADEVWAFPDQEEYLRSGTWSTVRYAHRIQKKYTVVMPDILLTDYVPMLL